MTDGTLAPRRAWLIGAALVLGWHGASGPHPFDAGELVQASFLLGGSHPPGQPLHAIVAHVSTLVPLGPIPWRMVWVSAAFAVVAAWLAGRIAGFLLEQLAPERSWVVRIAPDAVAFATLLCPPVIRQATRVEVYGIALALALGGIYAALRWSLARSTGAPAGSGLRVAALAAGLAAVIHPPHALAIVVATVTLAVTLRRDVLRRPRAIAWAAAACAVPLALVIAYLPVRGAAGAPMWGDPTSAAGLWDYLRARAYQQNLGADSGGLVAHVGSSVVYVTIASGVLPLLGVPFVLGRARAAPASIAALGALAGSLAPALVIAIDPAIADAAAYAGAPATMLLAIGGVGLLLAAAALPARARVAGGVAVLAALAIALPPISSAMQLGPSDGGKGPLADLASYVDQDAPVLETYGGALADVPPPRALVVVEGDFEAATMMMAQAVDGARPDIAAFVPGLATSSWHWRTLAHHPLYDGRPVRGAGESARDRYIDGAVRTALGRVPVAMGPRMVHGAGSVTGPYRLLAPDAATRLAVLDGSLGERLAAVIARDGNTVEGDHGTIGGVVRAMQVSRAERLAARRRTEAALSQIRAAAAHLPASERALLEGVSGQVTTLPAIVDAPGSFLTGAEDAVRTGAAILWGAGERERAERLLRAQLDRGDAAAGLQLGWLALAAGDRPAAIEIARAVTIDAPELGPQAEQLLRHARSAP